MEVEKTLEKAIQEMIDDLEAHPFRQTSPRGVAKKLRELMGKVK